MQERENFLTILHFYSSLLRWVSGGFCTQECVWISCGVYCLGTRRIVTQRVNAEIRPHWKLQKCCKVFTLHSIRLWKI